MHPQYRGNIWPATATTGVHVEPKRISPISSMACHINKFKYLSTKLSRSIESGSNYTTSKFSAN
jgi:hypothetical protein